MVSAFPPFSLSMDYFLLTGRENFWLCFSSIFVQIILGHCSPFLRSFWSVKLSVILSISIWGHRTLLLKFGWFGIFTTIKNEVNWIRKMKFEMGIFYFGLFRRIFRFSVSSIYARGEGTMLCFDRRFPWLLMLMMLYFYLSFSCPKKLPSCSSVGATAYMKKWENFVVNYPTSARLLLATDANAWKREQKPQMMKSSIYTDLWFLLFCTKHQP